MTLGAQDVLKNALNKHCSRLSEHPTLVQAHHDFLIGFE